MTVREMHYDFKFKLNKVDSQINANLLVPEIDWRLNEAQNIYVRCIAQPKYAKNLGFQYNQRSTDDIRTVISTNIIAVIAAVTPPLLRIPLPTDYMFFINAYINCAKTGTSCTKVCRMYEKRMSELHKESSFDNSSFEWEEVNFETGNSYLIPYSDGTFTFTNATLTYVKILPYIQNAQDFPGGTYFKADGVTLLAGFQNCILPAYTHSEIVDLAVAITAGDLILPDYQVKLNKLKLTE